MSVSDISQQLSSSLHAHTLHILETQLEIPKRVARLLAFDFLTHDYHTRGPPYTGLITPLVSYSKIFPNISLMCYVGASGYLSELRKETVDGPTTLVEVTHPPLYKREHHRLLLQEGNATHYVATRHIRTTEKTMYGPNATWWLGDRMPKAGDWDLYQWLTSINLSFGTRIDWNGTLVGFAYAEYTLGAFALLLQNIAVKDGVRIGLLDHQERLVSSNIKSAEAVATTMDALRKGTNATDPVLRDGALFMESRAAAGQPVAEGQEYSLTAGGKAHILSVGNMVFDKAKNHNWTIYLMLPRAAFFSLSDGGLIFSVIAVVIVFISSFFVSLGLVSAVSSHLRRIVSQIDGVVTYKDNAFSNSEHGGTPRFFRVSEVQTLQDSVRRMKTILQSFEKYIPVQLLKYFVANNQPAELGLERASASVMFLDVAGFTSIMERIPLTDLIEQFTEYCDEAISVIVQNHGTLDKMMGDGMMAFFGCAPTALRDHQFWAARCALCLQRMMVRLRAKWQREGRVPLHIRIGIASGPVSVGNMGSTQRFQFTVLGDVVNLASRMESLNKRFGTATLLTGHAYEPLGSEFIGRRLGTVRVKGRSSRTRVYELVSSIELLSPESLTARPLTAGQQIQVSDRSDTMDEAPLVSGLSTARSSILSEVVLSNRSSLLQPYILPRDPLFKIQIPPKIQELPRPALHLYELCALFSRAVGRYEQQQFEDARRLLEVYLGIDHALVRAEVARLVHQAAPGEDTDLPSLPPGGKADDEEYGRELLDRARHYAENPPSAADWDPVVTMTEK